MTEGITWDQLLEEAGDDVATSFDPLPAGPYNLEVVEAKHSLTSNGKHMWTIQSKVLDGDFKNRRLWDRITLSPESPKAMPFFFRNFSVLGIPRTTFSGAVTDAFCEQIAGAVRGRQYKARVGQRTYQGEIQNEVKDYLSAVEVAAPPGGTLPAAAAPVPPAPPAAAPPAPPVAVAPPAPAAVPPAPPVANLPF